MWARPAVVRGANVPEPYKLKELMKDKKAMEAKAEEVSNWLRRGQVECLLIGGVVVQSKAWVQKGMKEDAEENKGR